jgi:hypothetical protein
VFLPLVGLGWVGERTPRFGNLLQPHLEPLDATTLLDEVHDSQARRKRSVRCPTFRPRWHGT